MIDDKKIPLSEEKDRLHLWVEKSVVSDDATVL